MKSTDKVDRFDYSKYESNPSWSSNSLQEYEFWGIHPKGGRLRIDTKRYQKMCTFFNMEEFIPKGLLKPRNTVYFLPDKVERYDYKVNLFRDLIGGLIDDWHYEYKPLFKNIKTPKEIEDQSFLSDICYVGNSDDYDKIRMEAQIDGFKRRTSYDRITHSLYCQFIQKICTEIDRFTLIVMTDLGYKGTDYDFQSFCKFSDGLLNGKNKNVLKNLHRFNSYNMLHKINNFLKHNSMEAYKTMSHLYPNNIVSVDNGKTKEPYQNGMFAGDWLILKPNYIEDTLKRLIVFYENYCKAYLNEDVEESKWNYDNYFKNAFNEMKHPYNYFGI